MIMVRIFLIDANMDGCKETKHAMDLLLENIN
jgi:hypothetical protein